MSESVVLDWGEYEKAKQQERAFWDKLYKNPQSNLAEEWLSKSRAAFAKMLEVLSSRIGVLEGD